jgi:hypothetical protein
MRLKLIKDDIDLNSPYRIIYEFTDYDNNNNGLRKVCVHNHINQQYWHIERKGYEEWWYSMLYVCDKSFNI